MKTTLFYFSGTGNSLKVARDLAVELGNADIVPVVNALKQGIDLSAERIGIVFPVYMFGPPLVISGFIEKLSAAKDKYFFAIATYGGKAANTLEICSSLFQKRGLELSAGFLVKMPGNYTPLYGAIAPDKQNKLFQKEKRRVKEIAGIVGRAEKHGPEKDLLLLRWLFSAIYRAGSSRIPAMDQGFSSDDKCDSCGICKRVCPVGNIEMIDGRPKWLHHCQQCMACLQWCPQEAVQYGRLTLNRKRYHHPEIKPQDLCVD